MLTHNFFIYVYKILFFQFEIFYFFLFFIIIIIFFYFTILYWFCHTSRVCSLSLSFLIFKMGIRSITVYGFVKSKWNNIHEVFSLVPGSWVLTKQMSFVPFVPELSKVHALWGSPANPPHREATHRRRLVRLVEQWFPRFWDPETC